MGGQACILRRPRHLPHRQAIPVGGHESQRLAVNLHLHAGEQRESVIARGRDRDLTDGLGQIVGVDGTGRPGHHRQRGVVVGRHGCQGEVCRTARDGHLRALDLHVHRFGGQSFGDIRQQTARDEDDALVLDVCGDFAARRDFVVEGGEDERGWGGLQAHSCQDGDGGARGHRSGGPGHGLGQDVAVDPELHVGASLM